MKSVCVSRARAAGLVVLVVIASLEAGCAQTASHSSKAHAAASPALQQLQHDAKAVSPWATTAPAREFLEAVTLLPPQAPRTVFTHKAKRQSLTPAQHAQLSLEARAGFELVEHDEAFYYSTNYGTPVAYVRALDVAAQHGLRTLDGTRVLDIGYGAIGAPRLMASAGALVSALDVDSLLPALYRERSDQGLVRGPGGRVGSLALYDGLFAGDAALTRALGRHYDLIVSKNTLKRGFMKPAPGRSAWVDFGVPDAAFLSALHRALAPGGLLVIYNLAGKFDLQRPATDGRSPFERAAFEAAGFEVLALDVNDETAARAMGQALGWQQQMGDLSQNLFALYTVLRAKP
jgi:SAM-dependent methyltransferase